MREIHISECGKTNKSGADLERPRKRFPPRSCTSPLAHLVPSSPYGPVYVVRGGTRHVRAPYTGTPTWPRGPHPSYPSSYCCCTFRTNGDADSNTGQEIHKWDGKRWWWWMILSCTKRWAGLSQMEAMMTKRITRCKVDETRWKRRMDCEGIFYRYIALITLK